MERKPRKPQRGKIVSTAMQKTVVVRVEHKLSHPRYGKTITRSQKFYAHNEGEPLQVGDFVTIAQTRPMSKLKRWRVLGKV